jgi:hemolysin activation/secretion protein
MKRNTPFKLTGIIALLILAETAAWAVDTLPGSVLPEQVSKSLSKRPQTTSGEVLPPVVSPAPADNSVLGEQAKKIKFKLNGVVLSGNHVYTSKDLAPLYKDKIGKTISVADLFSVVQALTNYYRNNGYIISRAVLPPQHVKDGVVNIQIVEGYIDKVEISGHPKGAKCIVKAYGDEIRRCPPLDIKRMERYLLIANELPSTQVKAVLSPSKSQTGAADLILMTENTPVTGYVSYDNYGTRYIGPQQMTANVGFNSFLSSGDSTQFTMTKTPKGGELTYNDINYSMPIDPYGTKWSVGSTRAHTHPLFVLQPTQTDGLNNNYYTSFSFPVIRSRTQSLTVTTGFNFLDSEVTQLDQELYTDHVRSFDIGTSYNFADRWYGANLLGANFRQGLPILGYSSNYNPQTALTSRPGGRGDYTKFSIGATRLQAITGPFSAYLVFRGQWAFNPLLASEQFSFGGSQLGRGYDVAELIGDRGIASSIELRYDRNIQKFWIQTLEPYVFYDGGAIWNYKQIGGTPTKQTGLSTGIGLRFYATKYISGNMMWTQPITKQVAAEQIIGQGKRPRLFFSLVANFA